MQKLNIKRYQENKMKSVSLEIMSRFQNTLNESISLNNHHYYKKWLTYYWDFCHKYHHPVMLHYPKPQVYEDNLVLYDFFVIKH